jgi:hypothetical protein
MFYIRLSVTNQDPPGHHFHELYIDHQDMTDLAKGLMVTIVTTTDNSHDHKLEVEISILHSFRHWLNRMFYIRLHMPGA